MYIILQLKGIILHISRYLMKIQRYTDGKLKPNKEYSMNKNYYVI